MTDDTRWRRDTGWWDALDVPDDVRGTRSVFEWLTSVAPKPQEHDYILYTDGSGCVDGWGGHAAVWRRIELSDGIRQPTGGDAVIVGSYGSTVQRCEFSALLDGVHSILNDRVANLRQQAECDEALRHKLGSEGPMNQLTGPDRVSIMWFTDRATLAQCFLYGTAGDPLYPRSKERDLWMRWSFMARHVCLTPMYRQRNTVTGQAVCDELAGTARSCMRSMRREFMESTSELISSIKWNKAQSQKALF